MGAVFQCRLEKPLMAKVYPIKSPQGDAAGNVAVWIVPK
jgi:hypothetical protein